MGRDSFPQDTALCGGHRALAHLREGGPGPTLPYWCAGAGLWVSLAVDGPCLTGLVPLWPSWGAIPPGVLPFEPVAPPPPSAWCGSQEAEVSSSVRGQPAASSSPPSAFLGVSCVLRGLQLPSQVGRGEDHHARYRSWLHAVLRWEGGLCPGLWVTAVPLWAALQGLGKSDHQEHCCQWDPQE